MPGCLFIFLIGALIQRGDRALLTLAITLLILIVVCLAATLRLSIGFNKELILGTLVALVAMSILTRSTGGKVDTWLGDLSYGVYLSHMIVLAIVAHLGWFADAFSARCGLVIIGSLIAAAVGFVCVEGPVADYGRHLRKGAVSVLRPGMNLRNAAMG